jgi:hypothetical protein
LIHFTLELLQSDFSETFLFVSSIFLWIFPIPKLRVVSLDSLTIISFSVAYADLYLGIRMSKWLFDTIFE